MSRDTKAEIWDVQHVVEASARQSKQSLTDQAYGRIRHAIICWDLEPGAQVTELQLTSRFGLSRAAVRAALGRLAHDGLVRPVPRQGFVVAPITMQHVQDLFGVRLIVEPAAARLLAQRGDPEVVAQLEQLNAGCKVDETQFDGVALRQANADFHVGMSRATGNERLAAITRDSLDEMQRILYIPQIAKDSSRIEDTFAEHERIIAAIRDRDPATAERATIEHITSNRQTIIDALLGSSAIRSINLVRA
jgi:DNA-binding GntR family transcriptional regulator